MAKYSVYAGEFLCHTCKENVKSMRLYPETYEVSWMCSQKHLTRVIIYKKKTKKDYE